MRLKKALEGHPEIPEFGQGQQTWLATKLGISAEGIRKWFTGESRPRPSVMRKLAELLEVDEAWLSLGIAPAGTKKEKMAQNAKASGVVNVLAGLMEMNGASIAFPSEKDPRAEYVDLYAIIRGAQFSIHVSMGQKISENVYKFVIPKEYSDVTVQGAIHVSPMRCNFIMMPQSLIEKHKVRRGGYFEIVINSIGSDYVTGEDHWPRIKDFKAML